MNHRDRQRMAYLILAHTDPEHVRRLCATLLLDEQADIYIHVDLKSQHDFSACQALSNDRIRFISERQRVYWSGFNMVLATLALMRAAVDAEPTYHHLVLLSGQDYPLKHPKAIKEYLLNSPFPQHINRINALESQDYYIHQVTRFHFRDGWLPFTLVDKVIRKIATVGVEADKTIAAAWPDPLRGITMVGAHRGLCAVLVGDGSGAAGAFTALSLRDGSRRTLFSHPGTKFAFCR